MSFVINVSNCFPYIKSSQDRSSFSLVICLHRLRNEEALRIVFGETLLHNKIAHTPVIAAGTIQLLSVLFCCQPSVGGRLFPSVHRAQSKFQTSLISDISQLAKFGTQPFLKKEGSICDGKAAPACATSNNRNELRGYGEVISFQFSISCTVVSTRAGNSPLARVNS